MDVQFWGVRGSFPSPGKDKTRHGGHTPCASVHSGTGEIIVVDAGTGIKDLGDCLIRESGGGPLRITLLLTHFHLDHVIGFPFFAPLFLGDAEITVYAPALPSDTERYLGGLVTGRYFPVELFETNSRKIYRELPPDGLVLGGIKVSYHNLCHPQGSVGYRFEEGGKSVVFATDTEHPEEEIDHDLAEFATGASYFVCDATFTPDEYANGKRGWGHSTWLEGTRLAAAAGAGELLLSHLNPDHGDDLVDGLAASAREHFQRTTAARQGLRLFV
jgi:phosphoribosyl 1,2-cyclic phosphodiesterase